MFIYVFVYCRLLQCASADGATVVLLPVEVHLDGMVNDEVGRTDGINLLWVAA